MARLITRTVRNQDDLVTHFNAGSAEYKEAHGDAAQMLAYRLGLIGRYCTVPRNGAALLEIGCGTAIHLDGLANRFSRIIGADISPQMIRVASERLSAFPLRDRIELLVDSAEELSAVEDGSIDVVLCVGALEHMLDKPKVVHQVHRVLKPGGVFILLTPNGGYWWYTMLAPWFGIPTRHLSTDRFLTRIEAVGLLETAALAVEGFDYWTFIPKGDMPRWASLLLEVFDRLGRAFGVRSWRGGLILRAAKSI